MGAAKEAWRERLRQGALCSSIAFACVAMATCPARGQTDTDRGHAAQPPATGATESGGIPEAVPADEDDMPAETLPANSTPAQRIDRAWTMLTEGASAKHPATRIAALAALGLLRTPRSETLIRTGMGDTDMDVRSAAALAAGETEDRNLTTPLRNMLDDKEPGVVFTAATTLWNMEDRSGEDILMAVADGDRGTNPPLMRGTEHKIDKDLHDPGKMAKLGAMQGASMMMGPFGFTITAFNFIHQGGGNVARASAIALIAEEHTEPIHQELIAALGDKDALVRAAAARGLVDYQDDATSMAIYKLFVDRRNSVRLTAAAAYLRTTGVPGPSASEAAKTSVRARGATAAKH